LSILRTERCDFDRLSKRSFRSVECVEASLEEAALGVARDEVDRSPVSGPCFLGSVQPAQQIATGGMEMLVGIEVPLDRVDQAKAGSWTVEHGDGNTPIQFDNGRPVVASQLCVQHRDLAPVGVGGGFGFGMKCADRGLDLIATR
jgi:hypothetical protein